MMKMKRGKYYFNAAALAAIAALCGYSGAAAAPSAKDASAAQAQADKKAREKAAIEAKQVWQKDFKRGAVEDRFMKLNADPEPGLSSGFSAIFDGRTLKGWRTTTGSARFEVDGGVIRGTRNPADGLNSFLATEKSYRNFILTLEYRWVENGNSGVMVRAGINGQGRVAGPQIEIETDNRRRWTGGIYGEAAGAWKYSLSREDHEAARGAVKDYGAWNRLTVKCDGGRIQTWVNGVPCADFDSSSDKDLSKYKEGFVALQVHAGGSGISEFRNIKIREL